MWDSFGFYKIIRLAKPWTKHLIPAFCGLVTPIHQQNLDANKKNSLKINEYLSRGNKAIRTEQNVHWKQQYEIKPYKIQQFTKTKVIPSQVLFNINILPILSNIRVFTEIK